MAMCGEDAMKGNFYTFLLFTGTHGKLRKIRLPIYVIQVVLAFALVGVMTVAALANSYAKRSEEHTSELQSRPHLVCRLLLEKKKTTVRDARRTQTRIIMAA